MIGQPSAIRLLAIYETMIHARLAKGHSLVEQGLVVPRTGTRGALSKKARSRVQRSRRTRRICSSCNLRHSSTEESGFFHLASRA